MTTSESSRGREWASLAELEESDREQVMKRRYEELADLSEEERKVALASMEKAVYELSEDKSRLLTLSRLRTWLNLEPATAAKISTSFDAITDLMPGATAMRHIALVQTVAREFTPRDQARLEALFPRIFGALRPSENIAVPAKAASTPAKKSWWPFWKK